MTGDGTGVAHFMHMAHLTPVAGEVTAGGPAQPEGPGDRWPCVPSLFNPVIMAFGSRLACGWACVSRVRGLVVFLALTRANFIILPLEVLAVLGLPNMQFKAQFSLAGKRGTGGLWGLGSA